MKGSTVVLVIGGSLDFDEGFGKTNILDNFPWVEKLHNFISIASKCELNQFKFVDNFYEILLCYFTKVSNQDHSTVGVLLQQFSEKFPKINCTNDQDELLNLIKSEPYNDGFAYFAMDSSKSGIPNSVECENELYRKNANLLGEYPLSISKFFSRSKLLFSNLDFHEDIEDGFSEIKAGRYDEFTHQFVFALQILDETYLLTDIETSQNDKDLKLINAHSVNVAGNPIACTRETKSKHRFSFDIDGTGQSKEYICEFHLKLDRYDTGRIIDQFEKIDGKDRRKNNRVYFGMPIHKGRKRFIVAHMGKHL